MMVLTASCPRLCVGVLVQLVYTSSVISTQIKSTENRTAHLTETRSVIPTILESNLRYSRNLSDTFKEKNSSLPCVQRFFNSRTRPTENVLAVNSTFASIQNRIKRCLQADLAELESKRQETRSKIQQQIEDWKNKRSARPSKARSFSRSSISKKSSQTGNYEDKLFGHQNHIKKVTEKMHENEYPSPKENQQESTTEQSGQIISSPTTSFASFDFVPIEETTVEFETLDIPYATSGHLNLLTGLIAPPMNLENSRETNQPNSATSTEQPTEKTTFVRKFEKMHDPMESNSLRPHLDFLHINQNVTKILNLNDQLEESNNTFDSQEEESPQNSRLQPSNASWELNYLENGHNLEQDTLTYIDIVSSTPFPKIPTETGKPQTSRDNKKSSELLLPLTNENNNDDPSSIIQFQNTSDSNPQNFVNLVMRKTHKIQPGEVAPPMNPNENWKFGENRTSFSIQELNSFLNVKKRNLASEKGMTRSSPKILIDLNGVNETIIIDILKHNLKSAHQNQTVSFKPTNYEIFKPFSNSTDKFVRNGLKDESSNSLSMHSLIPQEDSYQRPDSSERPLATSDQELENSKFQAQLEENLFNAEDESALKFLQELLSLNQTFLGPNLDLNENNFNASGSSKKNSNNSEILHDECIGNTEAILEKLKDTQPQQELLEQHGSGCNKIVVIDDNDATLMKNAQQVTESKNFPENISSKELSILDRKNLENGKSANNSEETNITDRKNEMEGKSVSFAEKWVSHRNEILSSRPHNSQPGSRHRSKPKPQDPDEQLIKKQFSFVNPQVVDNFLDVYKHYSPRHSALRSRTRQQAHGNNARKGENEDWIPKPRSSGRNQPTGNVIENLLRELVRLRNSVSAAYVSHGYRN